MIIYILNAILPNHPTLTLFHRVQKTVLYIVSLMLSRIQGYHYHLSKFHIYVLVYCFVNASKVYCTVYASRVMLKILQVRLQQYVNRELPDVQAGFRKGRGTRNQIAKICWIMGKAREFQKNIYF